MISVAWAALFLSGALLKVAFSRRPEERMSEEPDKNTGQDAVRLKHEINKSMQYGGCNAREIKELEQL